MEESEKNCIFCKIIRNEITTQRILETNNFIAVPDKNPVTEGHTLIIPKKHFVTLLDIPTKLGSELLEITKQLSSLLLEKKYGDAFNIHMNNLPPAGQIIMHAHIHVIPRKENDNLKAHV